MTHHNSTTNTSATTDGSDGDGLRVLSTRRAFDGGRVEAAEATNSDADQTDDQEGSCCGIVSDHFGVLTTLAFH